MASKTISKTTNNIDITTQSNIDKINPPIPSPTSIEGISIAGDALFRLNRLFGNFGISGNCQPVIPL